jgi:hypothetical protein
MRRGNCPRCKSMPKVSSNGYCKSCARAVNSERRLKRKELFATGQLKIATKKKCYRCKKTKPAAFFTPQSATKDGLACWCKACTSESCTKSNKRRKYGMDEEAIIVMLRQQGNRCKICWTPIIYGEMKNNFHIDHDHSTGVVRSILCPTCNTGLGKFSDDPERVGLGSAYLLRTAVLNQGAKQQ